MLQKLPELTVTTWMSPLPGCLSSGVLEFLLEDLKTVWMAAHTPLACSPGRGLLGVPSQCGCWRTHGSGRSRVGEVSYRVVLRWPLGPQGFQPIECPHCLASDSSDPVLVVTFHTPPPALLVAPPGHPLLQRATQTALLSVPRSPVRPRVQWGRPGVPLLFRMAFPAPSFCFLLEYKK